MHISDMYGMEDIQTAIAKVLTRAGKPKDLDVAFGRLLLCSEFPAYFKDGVILGLFIFICRSVDHPTHKQLSLLQGNMDLIAHIMKGRVIFSTRTPVAANVKEQWGEDKSGSLDGTKAEVLKLIRKNAS
jgi:hypothetical protein